MRIAINTISTKKQSGGALQIAYNFLLESLRHSEEVEWFYITSSDVDELVRENFQHLYGTRYFVFPTQPDFKGTYSQVKKELAIWEDKYKPDVIYSISSPCYFTFKTKEVMRFANAWVTNPNRYAWNSLPFKAWLRMRLYRINQLRMLRKAKYIVTQSEIVGQGLKTLFHLPEKNVRVVPNVLPKVFKTLLVAHFKDEQFVDIACVASPFPHKNLSIIPKVLKDLKENHHLTNVRFHLTIPADDPTINHIESECAAIGLSGSVVNHGRCSQVELGKVYNHCSICFLPTLLETFSATSLEAMYFGLCIVATEFGFNKEIIGDAGLYYKPVDAGDAAEKIALLIKDDKLSHSLQLKMKERLVLFEDYKKHFEDIQSFLVEVGNNRV